jgi:hypothetical protein
MGDDNQRIQGGVQSSVSSDAAISSDAPSLETEQSVPPTRQKASEEQSSQVKPRKNPANRKKKARRPKGSNSPDHPDGSKRSKGRSRFSRQQVVIALIAVVVIFDMAIATFLYFGGGRGGPSVPPNPDPYALIQSQMSNNRTIAEVGQDSTLTFANYTNLSIVNTASLKPIENNLLRSEAGPNGADVLYDEQIVGRVLKLNSDWVDHLNRGDQSVFSSVQADSGAYSKIDELGKGSLVAYHRLAIGEIRHTGKNYYIITRASYTLTKDGQLDIHDELFVYKLVVEGNSLLVADFEQLTPNAALDQPQMAPEDQPSDEWGEGSDESLEGSPDGSDGSDGSFEGTPEGDGETSGEEQGNEFSGETDTLPEGEDTGENPLGP